MQGGTVGSMESGRRGGQVTRVRFKVLQKLRKVIRLRQRVDVHCAFTTCDREIRIIVSFNRVTKSLKDLYRF